MSEAVAANTSNSGSTGSAQAGAAQSASAQAGKGAPATGQAKPQANATGAAKDSASAGSSQGKGAATVQGDVKSDQAQDQLQELADGDMDRLVKVKVNGETKTMTVRKALSFAQLGQGAYAKMEEAAKARKQGEDAIQKARNLAAFAKQNPKAFMEKLGINPYDFAEATLTERLQMMGKTPEQRRLAELEAREAERVRADKERQELDHQTKQQREEGEAAQKLDVEISEAWKSSGLPNDLFYVKQIAGVMRDSIRMAQQGKLEEPLTAKDAADIVKIRFEKTLTSIFGQMDPQGILRLLGEENFNRLREWDVSRVTDQAAPTANSGQRPGARSASESKPTRPKGPLSEAEYEAAWKKL